MGLFKSLLSSAVGDSMADALTGNTAKAALDAAKKKAAKTAMESAAEAATRAAVGATVGAATSALLNKKGKGKDNDAPNALQTPPPPPAIPAPVQTMSVMVAVNGQTYGPYERATLLEMIINGSLTRDTYVFIQGMEGWRTAAEVPQVAALFGNNAPAPAVPPVPWAQENTQPAPISQSDNTLSPRLNQLINAAVADGEISDLERQVLIRNAQEEGVSMDEFVMVLEARLFEQQQLLREKMEEKARKNKMTDAQIQATVQKTAPQAAAAPKPMTKCPHCGAPVDVLSTSCPECGYDYPTPTNASQGASAWEQLVAKLEEIDAQDKTSGIQSIFSNALAKTLDKKVQAIGNHPIPTSKTDLVDFFTYCAPLGKKVSVFGADPEQLKLGKAYRKKAEQVLLKARIVLKNDKDLLEEIETIAKQYKIKA